MIQSLEQLTLHLNDNSDALVRDIIQMALRQGFTDQTSSMRAAWSEATARLNACLIAYLETSNRTAALDGRNDYRSDPRFDSLREIAWRHHDAGVPLELHHGLFKLYRRSYLGFFRAELDLGIRFAFEADPKAFLDRIDAFFDEADQAMLAPWSINGPGEAALADSLRRLTRERDQYFGVLESLRGPVFIVNEHDRLSNANQAALQTFLGLSEAGALTYRLAVDSFHDRLQAIVDEVLAAGFGESRAIWLATHQDRRCFDIRIRLIEDSVYKLDQCRIILMHDVTEHLDAVERAQNAERAMSVFLAVMSHEIRTPLHSVLGAASLLRDAPPQEVPRLIELLGLSAEALNATLANVLSFSRFEHQSPQPQPVALDLRNAMGELLRTKEILAQKQGVSLSGRVSPDLPEAVMLDWSMMRQVLSNLVQNALRHDDGRGVCLSLAAEGGQLVFQVMNHGPDVPGTVRQMLSTAPDRLQPRQTQGNGTGIGLAIAQRMTLALDGRLTVDHADGRTLFEVRVPLRPAPAAPPVGDSPDCAPQVPVGLTGATTCLLIEDDPISALVTIAMLERLGVTVDHATDLAQAEALCAAHPDAYDLFMVDYRLPDGVGSDLARAIRADVRLSSRPVFLLSANADLIRHNQPEDSRLFTDLLEKPLDANELRRAIRSVHGDRIDRAFLDGLSASARLRMEAAFHDSWAGLRSMLSQPGSCPDIGQLVDQAHKLASGARIFGQTQLAEALRAFEVAGRTAQDRGGAWDAGLAMARDRVQAIAPPSPGPAEVAR